MKGLLKWHIQPGKKRTVVVNFFMSGNFSFSFVSMSLAYITIPKSKRKKKLPEIKNLLQQDFYKVYIVTSAPLFCSKVLEDEEEAALEKEDQEREKEVLACNMLLLTCNYRGAAGKICSSSSNLLKKCSLAKKLWILSRLGTSQPNMSRHYQPISG